MPASGARRASRPKRLPIHAHATPRARSAAATASPGEVWPPVPPPAMTIMSTAVPRVAVALEGQRDQALDQLAVGEPRGLPEPRVGAGGGETGDRVDLVQDHAVPLEEEVDARHARGVDGGEGGHGELAHARRERGPDGRRHRATRLALSALRTVDVPLSVVRDLAGH